MISDKQNTFFFILKRLFRYGYIYLKTNDDKCYELTTWNKKFILKDFDSRQVIMESDEAKIPFEFWWEQRIK